MKKPYSKSSEPAAGETVETAAPGDAVAEGAATMATDTLAVAGETSASKEEALAGDPPAAKTDNIVAAYVPPPAVMKKLVRRSVGLTGEETISMPAQVYNKLLEVALAAVFDEEAYLRRFPDIKAAVDAGKLQSGLQHFLVFGYGEGRPPRVYEVDEIWYLSTYRDVAKAIGGGQVGTATQHFEAFGFAEGRAPNRSFEKAVGEWRRLEQQASKGR